MVRVSARHVEKDSCYAFAVGNLAATTQYGVAVQRLWHQVGPAQLRPESDTCVSVLWSGNTWNYRNALEEAGVRGAKVEDEDGEGQGKSAGKWYRILKSLDVTEEEKRVQNILKQVFQNLAMKVIVEAEPVEDSNVAEFIEELRKLPNLHFEK